MHFEALSRIAREETASTLAGLPEELRAVASRVPILLEMIPTPGDLELGIDPDLLGLFDPGPQETPHIRLWLGNLWEYAEGDPAVFREEVRITLLHEIGHLIGWGEDELEERGLG